MILINGIDNYIKIDNDIKIDIENNIKIDII